MFFIASKLFFALVRPFNLLLALLVIGAVAQLAGRRRLASVLVVFVAAAYAVIAFTPLPQVAISVLEQRFPRPGALEPAPDGIIVLGGAIEADLQQGHGDFVALNQAATRITEIPALASRYPSARIMYTGGPILPGIEWTEARAARRLFTEAGIDPARIVIEEHSLTTWENATLTRDIVHPEPGSRWLLVTSAFHMPRSVGVFRKAGWPGIIAYPTDFRAAADIDFAPWHMTGSENLRILEFAVKEYFGLVGYWLSGRSNALFPAP